MNQVDSEPLDEVLIIAGNYVAQFYHSPAGTTFGDALEAMSDEISDDFYTSFNRWADKVMPNTRKAPLTVEAIEIMYEEPGLKVVRIVSIEDPDQLDPYISYLDFIETDTGWLLDAIN